MINGRIVEWSIPVILQILLGSLIELRFYHTCWTPVITIGVILILTIFFLLIGMLLEKETNRQEKLNIENDNTLLLTKIFNKK